MQPATVSSTRRFYDLLTSLELHAHQQRVRNIQEHRHILLLLDNDLQALREKEEIYIQPLPEKTYCNNGKVRVTIQACDSSFQDRICIALCRRGYSDTNESTADVRVIEKDSVCFVVATTPQKKTCASSCSHHCRCNKSKDH